MDRATLLTELNLELDTEQLVTGFKGLSPLSAAQALQLPCFASPLPQLGLIRFSGEESQTFLQGQLSSDVRQASVQQGQISSYSTPKGRMQASFIVLRDGEDYLLQLDLALQEFIQKRLSMFVMRSKTRASDASNDWFCFGIGGAAAASPLQQLGFTLPTEPFGISQHEGLQLLALPGGLWQLYAPVAQAATTWSQLQAGGAQPVTSQAWELAQIRARLPWVRQATKEMFVPQMLDLEQLGGISFTKGCYPGQEIVARTQYLGKVKRRLAHASVNTEQVQAGDALYSPSVEGQSCGNVVSAIRSAENQWEMLVVCQQAAWESSVHLTQNDGAVLQLIATTGEKS